LGQHVEVPRGFSLCRSRGDYYSKTFAPYISQLEFKKIMLCFFIAFYLFLNLFFKHNHLNDALDL
jgi:hypothetical protein